VEIKPKAVSLHHHVYRRDPEAHKTSKNDNIVEEVVTVERLLQPIYFTFIDAVLFLLVQCPLDLAHNLEFLQGRAIDLLEKHAAQDVGDRQTRSEGYGC
jgi:hypothetical protein